MIDTNLFLVMFVVWLVTYGAGCTLSFWFGYKIGQRHGSETCMIVLRSMKEQEAARDNGVGAVVEEKGGRRIIRPAFGAN